MKTPTLAPHAAFLAPEQAMAMKIAMIFGTFDFLHLGHVEFFNQARKLGNRLVVVVARDANVKRMKGKKPFFHEQQRRKMVASLRVVDVAVLGDKTNFFSAIRRFRPRVIALGYDQKILFVKHIRAKLDEMGLQQTAIVRLKPFHPSKFKSSKIKKLLEV